MACIRPWLDLQYQRKEGGIRERVDEKEEEGRKERIKEGREGERERRRKEGKGRNLRNLNFRFVH